MAREALAQPKAEAHGEWEAVIGLEVHAQIRTDSKQFSPCPSVNTREIAVANRYVDPVSLGLPGTLPVLNRLSVVKVLALGMALGCEPVWDREEGFRRWREGGIAGFIDRRSEFARKHYFYPDLPKGYQISQYDRPLIRGGRLSYYHRLPDGSWEVREGLLERIHLEEDTGKLFHLGSEVLIDYNRSGVPLLELVTKPCFRSGEECVEFLETLRQTLIWLGISDANMEEGNFRCEPNISVRRRGEERLGVKTELKNLNSYAILRKAVDYEIRRQIELLESGGSVHQATLRWDGSRTVEMRRKETADDYRYFPEPDLPPLVISDQLIAEARELLEKRELPFAFTRRLVEAGVKEEWALALRASEELRRWFGELAEAGISPAEAAKWVTGEVQRLMRELGEGRCTPAELARLIGMVGEKRLREGQAKQVLERLWERGGKAEKVAEELGFGRSLTEEELSSIIRQVISENADIVEKIRGGKTSAIQALVGQVMRLTRGNADAREVRERLEREIGKSMET